MSHSEKRLLTAEDLYNIELVSDPQISPDGQHVIFGVTRVDRKTEKKYTNLWLVGTDGQNAARQFTYGDHNDIHPRWSPDGRFIAFLSMPVMGGIDATINIRAQESQNGLPPVAIHALTAAALDEERQAALQKGMNGYLTKPINKSALEALLSDIAATKASTRQASRA